MSLEKDVRVLDVWDAELSYVDRRSVKWMVDWDVVPDVSLRKRSVLDYCSNCNEGTMTETPM